MEFWNMVDMQNQYCKDCVAVVCHMDRQKCIESEEARPYFIFFNKSEKTSYKIGGKAGKKIIYCLEENINKVIQKAPPALTGEAV